MPFKTDDPAWPKPPSEEFEHRWEQIGFDIIDEVKCTCGWVSGPFYDGFPYALGMWMRHAKFEGSYHEAFHNREVVRPNREGLWQHEV